MTVRLKRAREVAGITAKELCEEAEISRAMLNNAERGKTVSYVYAAKIVNALNSLAGTRHTVESLEINTN